MAIYRWDKGLRTKADAQSAGERLAELHATQQLLTPRAIVDDARDLESPLHALFEWDDSVAAEQHRLSQARHVVRSIRLVSQAVNEPESLRVFVHVREDSEPHYTTAARAMSDEALRRQVLLRALQDLKRFRERYQEYQELARVFAAVDEAAFTLRESA